MSDEARQLCRIGSGAETCRYVSGTSATESGWACQKFTPIGRLIDDRVESGEVRARGDNCPGLGTGRAATRPLPRLLN